jgi:hypothetical protein
MEDEAYPYWRWSIVSHPTATFLHTTQPAKREKHKMEGISSKKTARGIS